MNKIIKSMQYLTCLTLILSLFSISTFADDASRYIVYNDLLFDRDGKMIIDDSQQIDSIKYKDHYWIVQLSSYYNDYINGNIKNVDNFKFAFEKNGDILTFKNSKNLTYLGAERIAYYYLDTGLSVMIDTDGNLISPKGSYYSSIKPFINGYAQVTTDHNEGGYLDLQGKFIKTLPPEIQIKQSQSSKNECTRASLDNIMQLCEKNNSRYLVNRNTGKETDVGPSARPISFESDDNKNVATGYFWLRNKQNGYDVYQIYDYDGKMHYENQFYDVSTFYGTTSWIRDEYHSGKRKYHLIDITGKKLGEYNYYHTISFGKERLYYATKLTPDNQNEDQQKLLSIIDVNGNVLFYEDIVGQKQYSFCESGFKVLKNAENKIVWPTNLERECLLDRYIESAKKNNNQYYRKNGSKTSEIPKDKIPEISRYFTEIKSNKTKNRTDFNSAKTYLAGPTTIKIGDIAELSIPEGYIYFENDKETKYLHCKRFVMPAYEHENRLCINIYKTGFINLIETQKAFNSKSNIDEIKAKVEKERIPYPSRYRYQKFEWLIEPEFNLENQSLKYGYRYHLEDGEKNIANQEIEYIKFAKDHIIVMKNDYYDDYNDFKPMKFDWLNRIKVFDKADITSTYSCSKLSIKDSALSASQFIYLDKEFCFPYPTIDLFYKKVNDRRLSGYRDSPFLLHENNYPIYEERLF
jgi:hypothetical protein